MKNVSAYLVQALWASWVRWGVIAAVALDELRGVRRRRGSSYRQGGEEDGHDDRETHGGFVRKRCLLGEEVLSRDMQLGWRRISCILLI